MKIQSTPQVRPNVPYTGNWLLRLDNALGKLVQPEPMGTQKGMQFIETLEMIARSRYSSAQQSPVKLSAPNGNKVMTFTFNNSAWSRFTLTKKGEEVADFEVLHVKGEKDYSFYSTSANAYKIIDKKYIGKYNQLIEEWAPRLIKRSEKQAKA